MLPGILGCGPAKDVLVASESCMYVIELNMCFFPYHNSSLSFGKSVFYKWIHLGSLASELGYCIEKVACSFYPMLLFFLPSKMNTWSGLKHPQPQTGGLSTNPNKNWYVLSCSKITLSIYIHIYRYRYDYIHIYIYTIWFFMCRNQCMLHFFPLSMFFFLHVTFEASKMVYICMST